VLRLVFGLFVTHKEKLVQTTGQQHLFWLIILLSLVVVQAVIGTWVVVAVLAVCAAQSRQQVVVAL